MISNFQNKVVLITGATNGIGKEILEAFIKTKALIALIQLLKKIFLKFMIKIKSIIIKLILILKKFQKIL